MTRLGGAEGLQLEGGPLPVGPLPPHNIQPPNSEIMASKILENSEVKFKISNILPSEITEIPVIPLLQDSLRHVIESLETLTVAPTTTRGFRVRQGRVCHRVSAVPPHPRCLHVGGEGSVTAPPGSWWGRSDIITKPPRPVPGK